MDRYQQFTIIINKLSREIKRLKNEVMADYGLKSVHVSCIYYLYKEEKLTSKEITEICDEDKGFISRNISFLQRHNYVKCEKDTKKRYNDYLFLTDKGKEIGKVLSDKVDYVLKLSSAGMSEDERKALYDNLEIIYNNLRNIKIENVII